MSKREVLITEEGLNKLKAELQELRGVRRLEVINRIKSAKELGDLSENAEYSSAKEEQSFIEGRIQELEEIIKHAKIAEHAARTTEEVGIGSKVTVKVDDETYNFEIVGPTESDPTNGKISIDSPVGKALLGGTTGKKVTVKTPDGDLVYKIVSVN